jgi:hypothetical protein
MLPATEIDKLTEGVEMLGSFCSLYGADFKYSGLYRHKSGTRAVGRRWGTLSSFIATVITPNRGNPARFRATEGIRRSKHTHPQDPHTRTSKDEEGDKPVGL